MNSHSEKTKAPEKAALSRRILEWFSNLLKSIGRILPDRFAALGDPKWQRWGLIVATALAAAFMMAPTSLPVRDLVIGAPAKETIISPITFQVPDDEATLKNRHEAQKGVLPIYDFDDLMVVDVKERINRAFTFMRDYLAREAAANAAKSAKPRVKGSVPEKKPAEIEPFRTIDDENLRLRFENLLGASISPSSFALIKSKAFDPRIENNLASLVLPVLEKGMVVRRDLVLKDGRDGIQLWRKSKEKPELLKDVSSIFDYKDAVNFIHSEDKGTRMNSELTWAIRTLALDLINANISYNNEKTQAARQKAADNVKPTIVEVRRAEVIIREGDQVTERHLKTIRALAKSNPPHSRQMILAGFALTLVLLLRLAFYFSEQHLERRQHATADLLLFCLLLLGSIILVRFVGSLAPLTAGAGEGVTANSILFGAPVAAGSMLVALMVGPWQAFIFAAVTGLTAALAVEGDAYLFCFYFVSGIVGLHGMSNITDRTTILRAGLVVGIVNMLSVVAIKMALGRLVGIPEFFETAFGFVGGLLSGLLVLGLGPLLEPLGYTTNVKLLELANLNHPILKSMSLEAPGTYHHSIMVGNLAEGAAELIGANPLLARVGALYHDIGKIGKKNKPVYFIENQHRGTPNPHDKLEPSMSALVLVSHVKYGVERARENRLGEPIVDIIQQHHGTSLIRFFYKKALERAGKDHHTVSEDKYHYPGPRPRTKEAALVMMADVVEAACRTLADPTPARVQKTVQGLIMGLFSDGQLDESTFTLKDLHAVTRSFVRAMQGILHSRIVYPEEVKARFKTNGNSSGQPTEKDRTRHGRPDDEVPSTIKRLGL